MPSRVVALWCWYHGGPFRGYQSQGPGVPTVQDTLISALRRAGLERNPVPCGRTDAGVHARMQVLSMRVVGGGEPSEIAARINAELPASVGVALVRPASPKFNAAWLSTGKVYRYVIGDAPGYAWKMSVERATLVSALRHFEGEHDFGAFHEHTSVRKFRRVTRLEVSGTERLVVRVAGDGFARFMVRTLIGAAVAVARGERTEAQLRAALADPTVADFHRLRAPPEGLTLEEVLYPPEVDPFSAEDRSAAAGVPRGLPFDA